MTDNKQAQPKTESGTRTDRYFDTTALLAFVDEYVKESDRAAVILIGAKLDQVLLQILKSFLTPLPGTQDNLLDTEQAIGTFSARINLVFRLGLIDAPFARALHLFRKIRNDFAHETHGASLEHSPHVDRIHELVAPLTHLDDYWMCMKAVFPKDTGARSNFFTGSMVLIAGLHRLLEDVTTIEADMQEPFIPPKWTKTRS